MGFGALLPGVVWCEFYRFGRDRDVVIVFVLVSRRSTSGRSPSPVDAELREVHARPGNMGVEDTNRHAAPGL